MVIDPDNGDGFALMWGGVRSTYGIRVPDSLEGFPVIAFQAKVCCLFCAFQSYISDVTAARILFFDLVEYYYHPREFQKLFADV